MPIARSTLARHSRRMDHGQKLSATLLPNTGPKAGRQFPEFRVDTGTGRQENGLFKERECCVFLLYIEKKDSKADFSATTRESGMQ